MRVSLIEKHSTGFTLIELLSEIGSNLTLKDKKLSVSNAKMYEAIINGLLTAKTKNTRFEPESIVDTSSRNEVFVDVCPTLLRMLDKFRTLNWSMIERELGYFTLLLPHIKKHLRTFVMK